MKSFRRIPAFLTLFIYVAAALASGADAFVLCRGLDGHVALESAADELTFTEIGPLVSAIEGSEYVITPTPRHHTNPCLDTEFDLFQVATHPENITATILPGDAGASVATGPEVAFEIWQLGRQRWAIAHGAEIDPKRSAHSTVVLLI